MAKFLTTTGVSHHLEELIKGTKERLILISPYLQINERIKENIIYVLHQKRPVHFIFREDNLKLNDKNWFEDQPGIKTSICKNLHAKCYMNEREAIITSMNLYDFSQSHNNEMGILISRAEDRDLFEHTYAEVTRLQMISQELKRASKKFIQQKKTGYCIRTGVEIPFSLEKPMCNDAYKSWSKYSDEYYKEKYCHFSGEPSNGETSFKYPILEKNWKKAQEAHGIS